MNAETIESIDKLIALEERRIVLLRELRKSYSLALRAGVPAGDIERMGYDESKDMRLVKWPHILRGSIQPDMNYVILKDGRRIDVPIDWETRLKEWKDKQREFFKGQAKRGY